MRTCPRRPPDDTNECRTTSGSPVTYGPIGDSASMMITSPTGDSEANDVHSKDYDASKDFGIRILPKRRIVDPIETK
eukprot:8967575-Karenia_brevis.AAC.1